MKMHNNLDEMQEQELLKIEHNGCWLAFWMLLAAVGIEPIAFGVSDFRMLAGEWIVLMVLCLYLAFACVRKGIWDRRIPMNMKSNCIVSIIAGLVLGVFNALVIFRNYHKLAGTLAGACITAAITFVLCFAVLSFMMKRTTRRKAKMEEEPADADEL